MILHIKELKYIGDYRVEVIFNDGRKGVADLADALRGPVFESLRDMTRFSQLKLDTQLETIIWPNGADLAPEYLYFKAFKDESELHNKFREWGYLV
jgi:hypothetical protein